MNNPENIAFNNLNQIFINEGIKNFKAVKKSSEDDKENYFNSNNLNITEINVTENTNTNLNKILERIKKKSSGKSKFAFSNMVPIRSHFSTQSRKDKSETQSSSNSESKSSNSIFHENSFNYCQMCKKTFLKEKALNTNLCIDCLNKTLKRFIKENYINFLRNNKSNFKMIEQDPFDVYMKKQKLKIQNMEISPVDIVKLSLESTHKKYNDSFFNEYILDTQSHICVNCFKINEKGKSQASKTNYSNLKDNSTLHEQTKYTLKLPCTCHFCSDVCMVNFLNEVKYKCDFENNFNMKNYSQYICVCNKIYTEREIERLADICSKFQISRTEKELRKLLSLLKFFCCMLCNQKIGRSNYEEVEVKNSMQSDMTYKHFVCETCVKGFKGDVYSKVPCKLCSTEHYLMSEIGRKRRTAKSVGYVERINKKAMNTFPKGSEYNKNLGKTKGKGHNNKDKDCVIY